MFWQNFIFLCAEKGISPNAVANELSLSSGSVTAWKGGTVPRETTLKKIANYFGVSVDYLINNVEKVEYSPDTSRRICAEIMRLYEADPSKHSQLAVPYDVMEEIENGTYIFSTITLPQFCTLFNTTFENVISEQQKKPASFDGNELDADTIELKEIWDNSSGDERATLLEMARILRKRRST